MNILRAVLQMKFLRLLHRPVDQVNTVLSCEAGGGLIFWVVKSDRNQ